MWWYNVWLYSEQHHAITQSRSCTMYRQAPHMHKIRLCCSALCLLIRVTARPVLTAQHFLKWEGIHPGPSVNSARFDSAQQSVKCCVWDARTDWLTAAVVARCCSVFRVAFVPFGSLTASRLYVNIWMYANGSGSGRGWV